MSKKVTYRQAGVDIEKAEKALSQVKKSIAETHNRYVLKNIGAFGGFYEFPVHKYNHPVLVASTDGVGTKLKVALKMNRHTTVGQDLVNHCINDIAVCGAKPLFFLDYFACGKLDEEIYHQIIHGFTTACKHAKVPLIGGETAEMPDMYRAGDYDLAGTIVGVVEREQILDGSKITEGDVVYGLSSNGLHTNGYSLARKILFKKHDPEEYVEEIKNVIGDELLKIHLNYYPIIKDLTANFLVTGLAHITGGGLYKNTIRIIPNGLDVLFNWDSWQIPAIFQYIQDLGNVPLADMRQTFNMGIGLVVIVPGKDKSTFKKYVTKYDHHFYEIGKVVVTK